MSRYPFNKFGIDVLTIAPMISIFTHLPILWFPPHPVAFLGFPRRFSDTALVVPHPCGGHGLALKVRLGGLILQFVSRPAKCADRGRPMIAVCLTIPAVQFVPTEFVDFLGWDRAHEMDCFRRRGKFVFIPGLVLLASCNLTCTSRALSLTFSRLSSVPL